MLNLLAQEGSKLVCEVSGTCLTRRLLRFVRNSPRTNGILTRECVGLKRSAMDEQPCLELPVLMHRVIEEIEQLGEVL